MHLQWEYEHDFTYEKILNLQRNGSVSVCLLPKVDNSPVLSSGGPSVKCFHYQCTAGHCSSPPVHSEIFKGLINHLKLRRQNYFGKYSSVLEYSNTN